MAVRKRGGIAPYFAFLGNLGGIIFPVGALLLLIVPGIWFYQTRQWMDSGVWPAVSVGDGLHWAQAYVPRVGEAAAYTNEKFRAFPLTLALLAAIGGPLLVYARFSQWLQKKCEEPAEDSAS